MPVQDQQEEEDERDALGDGAVEFDERRAKMERLRAEGIDPYPPVSMPDRTPIAEMLAAHDPASLERGEHPAQGMHGSIRLVDHRHGQLGQGC